MRLSRVYLSANPITPVDNQLVPLRQCSLGSLLRVTCGPDNRSSGALFPRLCTLFPPPYWLTLLSRSSQAQHRYHHLLPDICTYIIYSRPLPLPSPNFAFNNITRHSTLFCISLKVTDQDHSVAHRPIHRRSLHYNYRCDSSTASPVLLAAKISLHG